MHEGVEVHVDSPAVFSLVGMLYLGQDAFDAMETVASDETLPMYTPILKETFYVVNMTDVTVNGKSIGIEPAVYNRGDAIVDSGSTSVTL